MTMPRMKNNSVDITLPTGCSTCACLNKSSWYGHGDSGTAVQCSLGLKEIASSYNTAPTTVPDACPLRNGKLDMGRRDS